MLEPDSTTDSTKFINQLNIIKNKLNLTIQQLTILFNVSSKTIFDWYDEVNEPSYDTRQRIEALVSALNIVTPNANLKRLKCIWKIPFYNKSFLAIFQTVQIDTLFEQLNQKLREMSYLLMTHEVPSSSTSPHIHGNAHLAEFDQVINFNNY